MDLWKYGPRLAIQKPITTWCFKLLKKRFEQKHGKIDNWWSLSQKMTSRHK
jgi:hypothetical protein